MIINRHIEEFGKTANYMIYNSDIKYTFQTKINSILDKVLVCIFDLKFKDERWF